MNNFISTFEELNKLYEEANEVKKADKKPEQALKEECAKKSLSEAADDEEIEIVDDEVEIADDEMVEEEPVEEEEPKQVILECSKCGALVIKADADLVNDEESDLVNVEDECKFCEEANGYTIVGVVAPYEPEDVEVFTEDLADWYRKKFDRPASSNTQQYWEQRLVDLELSLDDPNLSPDEISKIKSEIKKIEGKFGMQRDWEARHAKDSTNEGLLDLNVPVNVKADGNTVTVGGIS